MILPNTKIRDIKLKTFTKHGSKNLGNFREIFSPPPTLHIPHDYLSKNGVRLTVYNRLKIEKSAL